MKRYRFLIRLLANSKYINLHSDISKRLPHCSFLGLKKLQMFRLLRNFLADFEPGDKKYVSLKLKPKHLHLELVAWLYFAWLHRIGFKE